jgi:hypothetical protein
MSSLGSEIIRLIESLAPDDQQKVIEFIRVLISGRPRGTPGRELLNLFGCISPDDAQQMLAVINEDCRRIEPEGRAPTFDIWGRD